MALSGATAKATIDFSASLPADLKDHCWLYLPLHSLLGGVNRDWKASKDRLISRYCRIAHHRIINPYPCQKLIYLFGDDLEISDDDLMGITVLKVIGIGNLSQNTVRFKQTNIASLWRLSLINVQVSHQAQSAAFQKARIGIASQAYFINVLFLNSLQIIKDSDRFALFVRRDCDETKGSIDWLSDIQE